jgi:hypothetical protein
MDSLKNGEFDMGRYGRLFWILVATIALCLGSYARAKGKPSGGGGFSNPAMLFIGPGKKSKGRSTSEVFLMSSDGSQMSLGVRTLALIPHAAWSPDLDTGTAGYQGAVGYTVDPLDGSDDSLYTVDVEVASNGSVTVGSPTWLADLVDEGYGDIAWSPDGRKIAVCHNGSPGPLSIVNVADGDVSVILQAQSGTWIFAPYANQRVSWSPDQDGAGGYQGQIAFVRGVQANDWELQVALLEIEIATDGTTTSGTLADLTGPSGVVFGERPTWSPDGEFIAYGLASSWEAIDVDGTSSPVTLFGQSAGHLDWSPDDTYLALIKGGDVQLASSDGTGLTNLTNSGAIEKRAQWCPAWTNDLD